MLATPTADIGVERPSAEVAVVVLRGEHDLAGVGRLRGCLRELDEEERAIVVDLSLTALLDSTILGVLLAHAERSPRFALVLGDSPSAPVRRLVEAAGIERLVPCRSDRRSAIAHVAP